MVEKDDSLKLNGAGLAVTVSFLEPQRSIDSLWQRVLVIPVNAEAGTNHSQQPLMASRNPA